MNPIILPFDSNAYTFEQVGGKGANLLRLTRAGQPVPGGFIISSEAYRNFVTANRLDAVISAALQSASIDTADSLEKASTIIREAFSKAPLPEEIESQVHSAWQSLGGQAVAVRSSATAEDLPELSFAGQQDTYLNITDGPDLLRAVIDCWSSLWTGRAIGYRLRNGIDQSSISLAVVVQRMVQSEVSGVLFTANPLTGKRTETVIDAAYGLGEALVSGLVEPDHFVVDSASGRVISSIVGSKKVSIHSQAAGGVIRQEGDSDSSLCLGGDEIQQLAAAGRAIQAEYGSPQDIEWALAGGKLYILQARAITSLYPLPSFCPDPLTVWLSFGSFQGMLAPMTPLGQDMMRGIVGGGAEMVGRKPEADPSFFVPAGERLWIKINSIARNPVGRKILPYILSQIDPGVARVMDELMPELQAGEKSRLNLTTIFGLAGFVLPVAARAISTLMDPLSARARFDRMLEDKLEEFSIPGVDGRRENLWQFLSILDHASGSLGFVLPRFLPVFAPGMALLNYLMQTAGDPQLALEITRGISNNVTTQMDLALWSTAVCIREDRESLDLFTQLPAADLAARYLAGQLPAASLRVVGDFLEKYGMRGVGEIDFGSKRWREDPTPVIHTLQSYLQIDPELAPDVLFRKGEASALNAVEELARRARSQPFGWFREKRVRFAASRVRALVGARESPKFFAIRAMGMLRLKLLEAGVQFAEAGEINQADDLLFLHLDEINSLATGDPSTDWKPLIAARRQVYERELRRRQVPRALVSDGRTFYEGSAASPDGGDTLTGSPVSPGEVEGIVHVVLDPRTTRLEPGEILVCPGTDPAWTPLFLAAGGLITEVGGMMTHGSVVAREYGIPAVVGVDHATTRLQAGQRIRLNGNSGKIVLIK